jgi:hypothetical protein
MAVTVSWLDALIGGSAVTPLLDHGQDANGQILDLGSAIFLEHDGANPITACKFYLAAKSGVYGGDSSAANDYNEMIAWGDSLAAGGPAETAEFGGFQINMNKTGGFPSGSWPTHAAKTPTSGSAFYTGVGDTVANGISLVTAMGAGVTSTGVIAIGTSPDASFRARIQIPTDEGTPGVRQFDQKLRFTYTS